MIPPRANPHLLGQDSAWHVLNAGLRSGRMPHGWLLAGPRGIGKATLAHRLARAVLAPPERLEASTSDPNDPTFRQCAASGHPDLVVVEPGREGSRNRQKSEIGVDAVRSATRSLHQTAALGSRRVLLVDGAELLNRHAVNALLKALEEPPVGTIILLVSHAASRLLPTVRSRCALLQMKRLEIPVIERILEMQAPELEPGRRASAARLAQGSAGRAIELARDGLDHYRTLVLALGEGSADRRGLHEIADSLRKMSDDAGSDSLSSLLQLLLSRLLAVSAGRSSPPLFPEEPEVLQRLARQRTLEQWPRLWEKIAGLFRQADALNLDRTHLLLLVLSDLASVPSESGRPIAPVHLGGFDAVG